MELKVEGLSFGYGGDFVIRDIELLIEEPGLVCIIGPNGVGKSTFLKCLNKILRPSEGAVYLGGYDLADLTLKDISEVVGYVPVDTKDGFSMTVLETVLLGRHPCQRFGTTSDYDLRIVHRVLNMMGIKELAMRRFDELSAGQRQKVCIAKGIAQTPRYLLLDEPTANLDVCHQVQVIRLLRDLAAKEGMTVVMISHDLNIASRYADRMILMAPPGIIYRCGSPEEVVTEDSIEDVYKVGCRIIDDCGRPHVILGDPLE